MDRVLRVGAFSRLVRPRRLMLLALTLATLAATLLAAIAFGSTPIAVERVVWALVGLGGATDQVIVTQLRLPRALLAVEAGLCLGLAGMLLQRATRNALASPDMLGLVDGAGLGVLLFLTLFSDADNALTVPIHWQPLAAGVGAAALLAGVFGLAGREAAAIRLILYGVALAAIAKAGMTLLMITGPVHRASQAMQWLTGSVHAANWEQVQLVAAIAAPLVVLAAALARLLSQADLDPETARATGLRVAAVRAAAITLAAGLTAGTVAFVGGIGFVGLIAPHLVRLLIGRAVGSGLLGAALVGALMVLAADLGVRLLFAPTEVPAGALTAVAGAPYLLYLLTRRSPTDG